MSIISQWVCILRNKFTSMIIDCVISQTGATCGVGTVYPSGAPEFTTGFQCGSCCSIFNFLCGVLYISLYFCPFFFWSLHCLSFDSRLLVTPLKLLSLTLKEVVSKTLLYISLLWKYTNGFGLRLEELQTWLRHP